MEQPISEQPVKRTRHRVFSLILLAIALCAYVWAILVGYVFVEISDRMISTGVLYLLMHYVTLSRYKQAHAFKRAWFFIIWIATLFITYKTQNIWLWVSFLTRNIAISSALHTLEGSLKTRINFNPLVFFRAGDALFSVFFVISFIAAFVGRNQEFNLTCDDITRASTRIITYTQEKFNFGKVELEQMTNKLIGGVIWVGIGSEIAESTTPETTETTGTETTETTGSEITKKNTPSTIENSSWGLLEDINTMLENNTELQEKLAILNSGTKNISPEEMLIMAQDYLLSGNSSSSAADIVSWLSTSGGLKSAISQMISDTMINQKQVTRQTCEVIITQVKNLYSKPWFVTSVLLSLFILLLPVLRITLYFISAMNIILFSLLKKLWIYRITKQSVLVDVVE